MLQTKQTHPTPEQLRAFALGQLDAAEQAEMERHIADCRECCERLADVPDDTFLDRLRDCPCPDTVVPEQGVVESRLEVPAGLVDHPRYRILRVLGAGGMGIVYHALHRLMDREVALKVIHPGLVTHPVAVQRFREEVKTAARLCHPNTVAALDAEQAGDVHFLVMEFVDGISLDRLVSKQGPLSVLQASHIIRQAALGLQHAHELGMVHRDIKPHNLMVTRKGQVKVLDFGLSRVVEEARANERRQLTMVGTVLGTPDYIAPEQVSNSRGVDIRADIYSLGCTLYFLLAGRPPFPDGDAMQKALSHIDSVPQPLQTIREDLPTELLAVIERMMARSPEQRYQTPAEVAQALAPFARPRAAQMNRATETQTRPRKPVERSPEVPPSTRPRPQPRRETQRRSPPNRRGWLIAGAAVGAVALVALMLAMLLWGHKPRALVVLPSKNFWWPDYEPVERVLREGGVKVVVASSRSGMASPWSRHPGAREIPVQLTLDQVNGADYDAIVFIGGGGDIEYINDPTQAAQAKRVISEAVAGRKLVTAICTGTGVLRRSGILKGRQGTGYALNPAEVHSGGVTHIDTPVVEDGNLITGRKDTDTEEFARRVLARLKTGRR